MIERPVGIPQRLMLRLLLVTLVVGCGSIPAHADIYRYVNEEGIECFTDAPLQNNATRIMREKPATREPAQKRTVPGHLAATGIADKTASLPAPSATTAETATTLPVQGRVTSSPGIRRDPIDGTMRNHQGVDIAVPTGTPVRPVSPGVIVYSGTRPGYGNMVVVEHGDGMLTLYANNSSNLSGIGEQVTGGTTIALSGSTGRSTGPHLHFEAWKDGTNLTDTFVPAAAGGRTVIPSTHDDIRRAIQPDGSILFTNIP